jgi:hypothetical protein
VLTVATVSGDGRPLSRPRGLIRAEVRVAPMVAGGVRDQRPTFRLLGSHALVTMGLIDGIGYLLPDPGLAAGRAKILSAGRAIAWA